MIGSTVDDAKDIILLLKENSICLWSCNHRSRIENDEPYRFKQNVGKKRFVVIENQTW